MARAAQEFIGTHDFTHFSNNPSVGREGICPIKNIRRFDLAHGPGQSILQLEVEGSGFLYKMVRHMTGALIAVGSGKLTQQALVAALQKGGSVGPDGHYRGWNIAAAHGLSLQQVFYPAHDDPNTLMLPQLQHDEFGRLLKQQNIQWVQQPDGSYKPEVIHGS
eukprot:CAMPEP_0117660208 /NCGR_PEP_ID=MMETSP0804-20121206/6846_1 /TAXON_ID=1074897 /ORGANISM="Tetraselmis astigmatica, Strain CCMP880" /LENGTH=162 /DNA_ID=CAMNT_0005466923 /DNA_START=267 /DNA_END=755 /DNA_ORIENTATION=-